jgi:hypothetical protein
VPRRLDRAIGAWCLYDFANSSVSAIVVATIFPVWYAEAIVGNAAGRGDFWWGLARSTTMREVAVLGGGDPGGDRARRDPRPARGRRRVVGDGGRPALGDRRDRQLLRCRSAAALAPPLRGSSLDCS